MKKLILTLGIILLVAHSASAHHFWVVKEADKFEVFWGHYPETSPYEPERVKAAKAFDREGKEIQLQRKDAKDKVSFFSKKAVSLMTLSVEGGPMVTTTEGRKRISKKEAQKTGLQIIDSVYSYQYIKSLFSYDQAGSRPVGMTFEIVPQENPFTLKSGTSLPIKIYFEGKPLRGASVEISSSKETVKTNQDGLAIVKTGEKGMQIISAKYKIPATNNSEADFLSYTTILTFEVR